MFSQLAGAIARGLLVVLLVATPSLLLPYTHHEAKQIVALVAVIGFAFTFLEYYSRSPSLVEFRDAPPFNRIRFGAIFVTVFLLSLNFQGNPSSSTLTMFIGTLTSVLVETIDFPYSPVRLAILMLPSDAAPELVTAVRTAAGLAYFLSILSLSLFVLVLRINRWPRNAGGFNVWTNMPTFDPTAGGDVVARLSRDSQVNIILGFLLPFIIPACVKFVVNVSTPLNLADPQTLIWMMTLWALLPSSLIMRGIAVGRIAQMIEAKRKRAFHSEEEEFQLA